jgi:hypothetical protein
LWRLLVDADLSADEKHIISEAIATIDNLNVICEHGDGE